MKLRNLKKATSVTNPTIVMALLVPSKAIDPIVELFVAATGVSLSPFEASPSSKHQGKGL